MNDALLTPRLRNAAEATLARITHRDFRYEALEEHGQVFLRVVCPKGRCTRTGQPDPWAGRKWRLSPHMTEGEIAQTALMATLAAVEHEQRELFKVDGVSVFDPHYDLNQLVRFRARGDAIGERDHPRSLTARTWKCPINYAGCERNCGNYGCGN